MATPNAYLVDGPSDWGAQAPTLEETPTGWRGTRHYRIDTRDDGEAPTATNLPIYGDPWSPRLPGLKVSNRRFFVIGGVVSTADQFGGWIGCEVTYETAGLGGTIPIALGLSWSEFKPQVTTTLRNQDARIDGPALGLEFVPPAFPSRPTGQGGIEVDGLNLALHNGRGVQVPVGVVQLIVSKYVRGQDVDIKRLLTLQRRQYVNRDGISVPPIIGDTRRWSFDAGELRYASFDLSFDRGLVRISHYLEAAPDWFDHWGLEDKDGNAVTERVFINHLFPAADFRGLW